MVASTSAAARAAAAAAARAGRAAARRARVERSESDESDVSDEDGSPRGRGRGEERRQQSFVGRVVGALTPANWGFRRRARRSESEDDAETSEEEESEASESESESEASESEEDDDEEDDEDDDDDDDADENDDDASRQRSGRDATTARVTPKVEEGETKASTWERSDAPREPTPWIGREAVYGGPFRDNVKSFLNRYATCDGKYTEVGIMGYSVLLAKGTPHQTVLRIYEETVEESERAHCDNCRCIGWFHHPVNKKQYHFIVHTDFRAKNKPELRGKRICQVCCCAVSASERKCSVCGDVDKECSILDHQTHLLHGELHGNGFGHLKRINGREAGSVALSGTQLMGLWERICYTLRAREVSVEDVSQKYGVEFRLLNPVACGVTWYGTYGYTFGKGSFGNTPMTHKRASEDLRKFQLKQLRSDFVLVQSLMDKDEADEMVNLVDKYTTIFEKEGIVMKTLGDLVSNVLKLQSDIRRAVKEGRRRPETLALHGVAAVLAGTKVVGGDNGLTRSKFESPKLAKRPPPEFLTPVSQKKLKTNNGQSKKINVPSAPMVQWNARGRETRNAPNVGSNWSDQSLNVAANACVLALYRSRDEWLSRTEVRNRAQNKGISDTALLDHVLKTSIDRTVVLPGGHERGVVRRRQKGNQSEFSLEMLTKTREVKKEPDEETVVSAQTPAAVKVPKPKRALATTVGALSAAEVDEDLLALYHDVLEHYRPALLQENAGQRVTCKGAPLVEAARALLDTKQFVKCYTPVEDLLDNTPVSKMAKPAANSQKAIRILVTVVIDARNQGPLLSGLGSNVGKARRRLGTETKPPPEMIFLPGDPTLGDLKRVASKAFSDLYVVLAKFKVTKVKGYEAMSDKIRLGWRKISGAHVEVHGEGADLESEFRYQGGLEQWTVKCMCGTGDDDGERMIACDKCEVWMHTRCMGIKDDLPAPKQFRCVKCGGPEPPRLVPDNRSRPAPRARSDN